MSRTSSPLGLHRVLEPPGVLPQAAWRLDPGPAIARETPQPAPQENPLQCVPYAREHSAVKLYGDAWTWWDKAAGKFSRQFTPQTGAVLVLMGYAGPERGHVAVVRSTISAREIHVDHANWLGDGAIYLVDRRQQFRPCGALPIRQDVAQSPPRQHRPRIDPDRPA